LLPDNRTIAGVEDCIKDRWLIKRTHCYGEFASDDRADDIAHGAWYRDQNSADPYVARVGHTMSMRLRPGESIVRRWDNQGKFHDNWRHARSLAKFANGTIAYRPRLDSRQARDFADEATGVRWDPDG